MAFDCNLMADPVVASDGFTYEREAITAFWSRSLGRRRDPLTNVELVGSEARLYACHMCLYPREKPAALI